LLRVLTVSDSRLLQQFVENIIQSLKLLQLLKFKNIFYAQNTHTFSSDVASYLKYYIFIFIYWFFYDFDSRFYRVK